MPLALGAPGSLLGACTNQCWCSRICRWATGIASFIQFTFLTTMALGCFGPVYRAPGTGSKSGRPVAFGRCLQRSCLSYRPPSTDLLTRFFPSPCLRSTCSSGSCRSPRRSLAATTACARAASRLLGYAAPMTRTSRRGFAAVSMLALLLAAGAASVPSGAAVRLVTARVETRPVPHTGDAADDAAIWVHPRRRARSTIIGTDKDGGIAVYDLKGRLLQYRRDGRLNNVDLRGAFRLGSRRVTLVTATNRSNDTIAIYRIAARTRRLVDVRGRVIHAGPEVYGLCMYRSPLTGRYYVFVTSESGRVEQWRLFHVGRKVDARRVRRFEVGSQTEGCVADVSTGPDLAATLRPTSRVSQSREGGAAT
jgi:hypothetical protein